MALPYFDDRTMQRWQEHIPDTGLGGGTERAIREAYATQLAPDMGFPISPSYPIGSVVRLKSGGPAMTVVGERPEKGRIECNWFDKNDMANLAMFALGALVLAAPPQPAAAPLLAGADMAALDVPPTEIVVTDAMASAGVQAWSDGCSANRGAREIVRAIYAAMQAARART